MANELQFNDTFSDWRDKLNGLIQEFNDISIDEDFGYDVNQSVGLSVRINGGKVRDGSFVEDVASVSLMLPANASSLVAIFKEATGEASIVVYPSNEVPDRNVIPLGLFETGAALVTMYKDLRTEFSTGSGASSSSSSGAVLMFDRDILEDVTIPEGRNAVSVAPVVTEGVNVTVSDGSVWVVL